MQRYKCKECNYNYTVSSSKLISEREEKHQLAFTLHNEGHSFHAISRILGVSHVSVMNWIRKHPHNTTLLFFIFIQSYYNYLNYLIF